MQVKMVILIQYLAIQLKVVRLIEDLEMMVTAMAMVGEKVIAIPIQLLQWDH